ncbi:hypothetical protein PMAYCL1PPCAC_23705 [Pristionchus mayeri]|uniref:tRNA (adenine(58)-N(1))-methyltransferase catalytic subunit TRMT61A n=1 Tax=Pristionchus mayeri TaxID=1317129 RepID=A0AAN5CZY3_9BILA|nr:hypothetical protein PMAYCL1PPCAC_23705 [Pristionchus mayeri]
MLKTESTDSSSQKGAGIGGPSFVGLSELIEEGDTVIVYVSFGSMYPIVVKRGMSITMKFGQLRHEFLIGKQWGSRVTTTAGFIHALRPTSDLWTRCLPKRTQILYTPDVSLILSLLDVRGGSVVAESGTGSGSLSHALAIGVLPDGHVYTHDIDETRTRKIEAEFKEHGLSHVTTPVVQNVCVEGFFVENSCDGVFLDVPCPWEAVENAVRALSKPRGGRLVSFSPCIEQVQRTASAMREAGFVEVECIEIVPRQLMVVDERKQSLGEFNLHGDGEECAPGKGRKRKTPCGGKDEDGGTTTIVSPSTQPTHTGYLISATMLPRL